MAANVSTQSVTAPLSHQPKSHTTTSSSSLVELVSASELRLGKYCMVEGFPCRIRAMKRSAPGKHGHAKLRIVGTGVLDDKKRTTIYGSHNVVQVPIVEKFSNVPCVPQADGSFEADPNHELFRRFPILYASESNTTTDMDFVLQEGQRKTLTVIVTCGQYRVGAIENDHSDAFNEDDEDDKQATTTMVEPTVLSKKELRKRKKQQKKKEAVMAAASVADLVPEED